MTQSTYSGIRAELAVLIEELLQIIERQGGSSFSPGVNVILATLQDRSIDDRESVREASRTYIGITGLPNSLSDFFVWDDDIKARSAKNARLNQVRESSTPSYTPAMAMFDWFEPNPPPNCPACGDTPSEWQGTDGPNVLLVWSQGQASPTEHKVDAELQNLDGLRDARLPDTFSFGGWDANDHLLEISGSTLGGVWTKSTLVRVSESHQGRKGRSFTRVLWGTPDPLTPRGTSDR